MPNLGVWTRAQDIDWERLPGQFVLKPNHGSGWCAIVNDKGTVDQGALAREAQQWLSVDYFDVSLQWGYRNLRRRLLAEPLLVGPDGGQVIEAQAHCFWGVPGLIRILQGRKHTSERRSTWLDATGRRVNEIGRAHV